MPLSSSCLLSLCYSCLFSATGFTFLDIATGLTSGTKLKGSFGQMAN